MHDRLPRITYPKFDASPCVQKAIAYAFANFSESLTLDDLAAQSGMTPHSFCRKFQRECGMSPMRWLWTFRVNLAAELLVLSPSWTITDIAFFCGFGSSAHFGHAFDKAFGCSPTLYRVQALDKQSLPAEYPLSRFA